MKHFSELPELRGLLILIHDIGHNTSLENWIFSELLQIMRNVKQKVVWDLFLLIVIKNPRILE